MAAVKIIVFTAGEKATADELAAIAKLNKIAEDGYEVVVRRGDTPADQWYGAGPEAADFVTVVSPMTVPTAYASVDTFDPSQPAAGGNLEATQTLLSDGQSVSGVSVTGSGTTATFTIAGGVITDIALA